MILREAFRYQNFLSELKDSLVNLLHRNDTILETIEYRNFSSANSEKADEAEVTKSIYNVTEVIAFFDEIVKEKEDITKAISNAKKNCEYDIDALLELNKFNSDIISLLKNINGIEGKETKGTDIDYKFNVNGEQISYRYPTKKVSTINFDRKKTKGMAKTYSERATEVSNLIDRLNVTLEVEFTPKFNLDDKLEDILSPFKVEVKPKAETK